VLISYSVRIPNNLTTVYYYNIIFLDCKIHLVELVFILVVKYTTCWKNDLGVYGFLVLSAHREPTLDKSKIE
jgi:hypothetical protein